MDPNERKVAFKAQAERNGVSVHAAAFQACGVTWFHLSEGIKGNRPLSADVKAKFAAYLGRSVRSVFGPDADRKTDAA